MLPILSKILERAVHSQLLEYLESNKLISDRQFGYRRKRSTKLAATIFADEVRRDVDQGKLVGAIFIDLSKAFDTISHSVLLEKLPSYGINDLELEWITDYLFQRYQCVRIKNIYSNKQPVYSGVPQGSILGPLLFMLMFNDFSEKLKYSRTVQYADDTVIYFSNKDFVVIENSLSEDLSLIADYFDKNELVINLKKGKTECMLFGTSKRLYKVSRELDIYYRDTRVNVTTEYKYLGNVLDSSLSFNKNFESSYRKASGRIGLLRKLKGYLTQAAALSIYKMMVIPTLTYAGPVKLSFTKTQLEKMDSLERRANSIIQLDVPKIYNQILKEACILTRKCLIETTCENFHGYFAPISHTTSTRNNKTSIVLPRVKLAYAKNSFYFMGGKVYNDLPAAIREAEYFATFKRLIKGHFN